jgi:hypothetical protein
MVRPGDRRVVDPGRCRSPDNDLFALIDAGHVLIDHLPVASTGVPPGTEPPCSDGAQPPVRVTMLGGPVIGVTRGPLGTGCG